MKCSECDVDIPPAWKHSYESNHCPSCGGRIFDDNSVSLMKELKAAMENMPNDPQGLAGWLLSNYRMQKVGDGEPTGFYGAKPQMAAGVPKEDGQLKVAPNRLHQFLKNAGVKPQEPERMAHLAKQINNAGLDDGVDYGIDEQSEEIEDDGDFVEEANDPEFTKQVLTGMTPGSGRFTATERKALMQKMATVVDGAEHPVLQDERRERLRKQQELAQGGAIGKITRR
jgi:DNA-directed RNA polymerase subunit RPC12/RpoP